MRFAGFIGPSYTLDSLNVDAQRCINLYPKLNEMGQGKSREVASLVMTPGLELLASLGSGEIRGTYVATNGFLYAVSGEYIYYINSLWEAKRIGKLSTSTGAVDFADNGTTMVIVDGPDGYWHTLGSIVISKIAGESWRGSNRVGYIDGYFMFISPDTGIFYISNLNSIVIDALDFASTDGSPDNIISMLINHREVWLFGDNSIEVWYNSGNAAFPFNRISGAFIEMGLAAAHSVAKIDKTNFWLGKNKEGQGVVYAAQGLTPQRVSTHAVELAIQSYGDISDARAWTYQENGHSFYVLNFTGANTTWVYDTSTNLWHERAYLNTGKLERHRANSHSFAYNTHVVGDYQNGKIYKLNSSKYSDNGDEIKRVRTSPHLSETMKRIQHKSFQLDIETGTGLSGVAQGIDPKVILEFSNDGGHTWSNEKWAALGKIGNKKHRVIWRRLGIARDRVYRISITDPVKVVLIGAELELEGMSH